MNIVNCKEKIYWIILVLTSSICLFNIMKKEYIYQESHLWETVVFCYDHNEQWIELTPWYDETDQIWYVVLPSFIDEKAIDLTIAYDKRNGKLSSADKKYLQSGELISNIQLETIYEYTVMHFLSTEKEIYSVKFLKSENLPTMMIQGIGIEDMMAVRHKTAEPVEHINSVIWDMNGQLESTVPIKKISIHGNWTAGLSKTPFNIELEKSMDILGMEAGKEWVLLANATDGTYIRNKAMLDLANVCAPEDIYQPDGQLLDLYVNGIYYGIYLLTEKVNIEENRLEIEESEDFLYNVMLDNMAKYSDYTVMTDRKQLFELRSKREISSEELEKARQIANEVESALYSSDGRGAKTGKLLSELIDYDTWAWNWIMLEISGDHDTGIASQYFYTAKNGMEKMYAGPVWDFDGIWGNVNKKQYKNPNALLTSIEQVLPEHNPNQNRWMSAAYTHEDFRDYVAKYYEVYVNTYLEDLVQNTFDDYLEVVEEAAELDALRWNKERLTWPFDKPEDIVITDSNEYTRFDTLDIFAEDAKEFVADKQEFLENLWIEDVVYHKVEVQNSAPFLDQEGWLQTRYYWKEDGEPLGELPWYDVEEYNFYGYMDTETNEYVNADTKIYKDCVLQAIWD